MKWKISEIQAYPEGFVPLNEYLNLETEVKYRRNDVISLDKTHIEGYFVDDSGEIILHASVETSITLPSTRSLKPVTFNLEFGLKERYVHTDTRSSEDSDEVFIVLNDDYIDLANIIADAIVVNIPIKIIGDDESDEDLPSGDNWQVLTEDEYLEQLAKNKEETVDPRFQKLQSLLENQDISEDE